ncbi:MAG: hypothetical protein HKN44_15115 [Ilumatobacter sp.]|nr:hypothetical protein [Ilumatobacter sp.]
MVTLCWAAKGGSGTTVVTTLFALEAPRPTLLVDLAGETPAVLGLPDPDRPGVVDWLRGSGAATQLDDLVVDVDASTALLPCRVGGAPTGPTTGSATEAVTPARWGELIAWLDSWAQQHSGTVWVDHGTGVPSAALAELVQHRLLVTRPCYLALRRAAASPIRPTGVVVVSEARRSLGARDIERSLGAPVVATIPFDPHIARAVDAGLLVTRAPFTVRRELRRFAA